MIKKFCFDKNVMITGSTSGIGQQSAMALAQNGARVILVGRDEEKLRVIQKEILNLGCRNNPVYLVARFSSLQEIIELVKKFDASHENLDILINNAGYLPAGREILQSGIEKSFCVNHLAPMLLTLLLLNKLSRSKGGRVIHTSSSLYKKYRIDWDNLNFKKRYSPYYAYGVAKLSNMLFHRRLTWLLKGSKITSYCLHPGVVSTNFGQSTSSGLRLLIKLAQPLLKNPKNGAKTTVFLASENGIESLSGSYFFNSQPELITKYAQDPIVQKKMWKLSLELIKQDLSGASWEYVLENVEDRFIL